MLERRRKRQGRKEGMDSNISSGFRDPFPLFLQDSRPYPSQSLPSVTLPHPLPLSLPTLFPSFSLHHQVSPQLLRPPSCSLPPPSLSALPTVGEAEASILTRRERPPCACSSGQSGRNTRPFFFPGMSTGWKACPCRAPGKVRASILSLT